MGIRVLEAEEGTSEDLDAWRDRERSMQINSLFDTEKMSCSFLDTKNSLFDTKFNFRSLFDIPVAFPSKNR